MKETEKMKKIRTMLNILNEEIKMLTELVNLGMNEQTVILQLKQTEIALDNLKKEYNYDK